ncbi:Gfo/Idh/MocA family oxidoreductase [Sphaerisporangium sp. TRM90804]|uniref:Gfo/Idh/MocA family protein n=1 Tax=Sphaerisporangium sp. TRM90804 TaxID=3031113 RepID=UPI002448F5AC|nr:Gfo/Idh/MocA family oxidoreductase [Sphaerisporangium sp. TRM90804]MDH2424369.1 Gfo/Idh/MocA family oxidoreductase [Sphaerisporangium sp. TRM90804]
MIRVAIVGAGGIAGICHMPALAAQRHRAEVVAVVDVDGDRAKAFCGEHGVPGAYTDLGEMLARERPDLVHVCTPPHLHARQAVECLRAGAWVWVEKPMCLSLAEHDLITAAESGAFAAVVFQHRFGSGARHLRELAASGVLGRPMVGLCVTAWYRDHAYYAAPWRGRWDTEGGGPTMGHGIHQMDLMLSVLGDWEEIRAMARRLDRPVETEDVSMATVRFAGGAMASVVNSVLSRREESYLRFDFEEATVELRHLYGYSNHHWTSTPPEPWNPPDDVPSSHSAQLAGLLDAYEAGRRPPLSGAESRRTLEFVTGLYASAFTGRPVRRAELTIDNPFYHRLDGGGSL